MIEYVENTVGKGVTSIFSFPTVFSKASFFRVVKSGLCGKDRLENIVGEGENVCNGYQHFLLFKHFLKEFFLGKFKMWDCVIMD